MKYISPLEPPYPGNSTILKINSINQLLIYKKFPKDLSI